ncbi:exonuclease domain-containing protein [Candidatus Viridilinea mediisalina]|uniref:Helicase ATP-binding domain-containing protein n=1 Tax=Candidatus Viridilinea mediisalina TaxID=2024553 RepID=A0A2A6RH83_9CHLR|nr:exonuclease domain-containing protein [Candidatus Viridilinea mediisalina]PDW02293.1 hypothetical protein CJ255_14790 [Candidatus Viridilinea mediisalina]
MSASATPLNQRIQRMFLEREGVPIALLELQRLLRRQGYPVDLKRLRALLTADLYMALADDRFVLRDHLQAAEEPEQNHALFLVNLPLALETYVVLDLETTGLHPEDDQIIQVAALQVVAGQPTALRSWYVQAPAERLTPALQRALYLDQSQVAAIVAAAPLDLVWPEVCEFLAGHALVIHNARFDTQFLLAHAPRFPNPVVDALELAYLVAPEAPRHNLGELAAHLGIDIDHLPPLPPPQGGAVALLDHLMAQGGLRPRASQRTMVERVEAALAADHALLIEVPTGTGKTLAYLLPAALAAVRTQRRIALATAFKNLQDQLRSEVERLQRMVPFTAQLLKGAASYLCLRALHEAISAAATDSAERRFALAFLATWAGFEATLDELPYWLRREIHAMSQLEREVAVDLATCTAARCPFYVPCHYYQAYRRGAEADLLLINQSLWLTAPSLMPAYDALVIDEAHNLEAMATGALTEEVGERSLRHALLRLTTPGTRRGALQALLDQRPPDDLRTAIHQARRMVGQSLKLLVELRETLATFVAGCDERLRPAEGVALRLTAAPARVYPTRWPQVQQALDQLWQVYLNPLALVLDGIDHAVDDREGSAASSLHRVCSQQDFVTAGRSYGRQKD